MNFDQIKRLKKRADHFCGPIPPPDPKAKSEIQHPWALPLDAVPSGAGVIASNYSLMQEPGDDYHDRLLWLDAAARAFNRYIDAHAISNDENAKRCLSWWREQLFFSPELLQS